jgi:hypothetical protein
MNLYWALFKIVVLTFSPLVPINPKLTRPDPVKNAWVFECESFTSCFELGKVFYKDTLAGRLLTEKSA